MKLIIIAGDSHGDVDSLKDIAKLYPHGTLFLHTGDSQRQPFEIDPFITVKGNNDYFIDLPDYRIISSEYGKILLTHGHKAQYFGRDFLDSNNIRIVISGHTHRKSFRELNGIKFYNPGSILFPRDDNFGSYLKLQLTKESIFHEFVRY